MKIGQIAWAAFPLFLMSCGSTGGTINSARQQTEDATAAAGEVIQGSLESTDYYCFGVPSVFNRPGWIFRVAQNGVRVDEGDVSGRSTILGDDADALERQYTKTSNWGLGAFLSALQLTPKFGAEAGLNLSNKLNVTTNFSAKEITSLIDAKRAANQWVTENADVLSPQDSYYLVRRALAATQYTHYVDKDVDAAFGGEANFVREIKLSSTLNCDASEGDSDETENQATARLSDSDSAGEGNEADENNAQAHCKPSLFKRDANIQYRINQSFKEARPLCIVVDKLDITIERDFDDPDPKIEVDLVPVVPSALNAPLWNSQTSETR